VGQRLRKKNKEKKKEKKEKEKNRVSSNRANINANIPTAAVSNILDNAPKKKKAAKIIVLAKKCKPFLGVLVSTSLSASLPATGACKNKNKVRGVEQ
jgi:hypothetical protein